MTKQHQDTQIATRDKTNKSWIESSVMRLAELLKTATTQVLQAAELLCELLDKTELEPEEIARRAGVPAAFIQGLERVGRKQMHPDLFMAQSPGERALRSLPYSVQTKHLEIPVEVLVIGDSGKTDVLRAAVNTLSPEQTKMVFCRDRIRSAAEQRAWLEGKILRAKMVAQSVDDPFRVVGKSLVVLKPCKLEMGQILSIAALMAGK